MTASRIRRTLFGTTLGQLVNIGYQFILVPFFIASWGASYYGEWLLLYAIPAYFVFTDFGMTAVVNNALLQNVVQDKIPEALALVKGAMTFLVCIMVGLLLLAGIILKFIDVSSLMRLKLLEASDTDWILILLLLYTLSSLFLSFLLGLYKSVNQFDIGLMISNSMKVSELITVLVILFFHGHALELVIGLVGNRWLVLLAGYSYLMRRIPWLTFRPLTFSLSPLKPLWKLSFTYMFLPVGQAISLQGSTIIIGMLLGPVQTVLFTTTRTLVNVIRQLSEMIKQTIWVDISRYVGLHALMPARKLFVKALQVVFAICILVGGGMLLIGPALYQKWTKHQIDLNMAFFAGMVLTAVLSTFWQLGMVVPESTNKHSRLASLYLITTIVGLLFSFLLIPVGSISVYPLVMASMDLILIYNVMKNITHQLRFERPFDWAAYRLTRDDFRWSRPSKEINEA